MDKAAIEKIALEVCNQSALECGEEPNMTAEEIPEVIDLFGKFLRRYLQESSDTKFLKPESTTYISIHKCEDGVSSFKDVTIAACPFCKRVELIVDEVDLDDHHSEKGSSQVLCGGCGVGGPWDSTEEGAVRKWNDGLGYPGHDASGWLEVRASKEILEGEFPF